ncbi:MAG: aminotransferase class [Bacilli bacterium]|nr:aminotransferase class [Bacilli bacterium]
MGQVWVKQGENASWQDSAQAAISLQDRGFQYGDGLFETIRVHNGNPRFAEQHLARLAASQQALGFRLDTNEIDQLLPFIFEAVRRNHVTQDGIVKLIVTRGSGNRGFAPPDPGVPTIVLQATSYQPLADEVYQRGLTAIVCSDVVFSKSRTVQHKTLSCLDKIIARGQAQDAGADEAILVNEQGQVTETTSANLFCCLDEEVRTSPVSCGLLPGIARQNVIRQLHNLGYRFAETPLLIDDLKQAKEVWLTNSALGVIRLNRIQNIGEYKISCVYDIIRQAYWDDKGYKGDCIC